MAMDKSKPEPPFLMSEGARLIGIYVEGTSKPEFLIARAVTALAHSGVRQTHGVKVALIRLDSREVNFDIDDVCVDAVDSGAEGFEKHKGESLVGGVYMAECGATIKKARMNDRTR